MRHRAPPEFWEHYDKLPADIQNQADRCFALLAENPRHPSLRFKRVGPYWSARVGLYHRALGKPRKDGVLWFWIGAHDKYDRMLRG